MLPVALLLSLPFAFETAPRDDVSDALAALTAPASSERERAERWLVANLDGDDFASLRTAVENGDPEVRRRLARALAAADRHLPLAVRFLGEQAAEPRRLGEEAVRASLARWNPALLAPPLAGDELKLALEYLGERGRPTVWQVDLAAPLVESLETLGRREGIPLAFVPEPGLPTRPSQPSGGGPVLVSGPWADLVWRLAGSHGVGIEAFGIPAERGGERGPGGGFLHFTPRSEAGKGRAGELVVRWCAALGSSGSLAARTGASRALAATGWPSALGLLEHFWDATGDEAGLEGLLAAAGRGRVSPALLRPAAVRALVAQAESDLDASEPARHVRAHRVLFALGAGGARGPGGEDLAGAILGGWDEASPRGRWLRLALLETAGGAGDGRDGDPLGRTRALLTARPGGVPPELLVQALRTWNVLSRGRKEEIQLSDPVGLLLAPQDWEETWELVSLLLRAHVVPPATWRAPADLPARFGPSAYLTVFAWWFERDEAVAADHLRAFLEREGFDPRARGEKAGEVLARGVRRGERRRARAVVERARAAVATDAARFVVDRVAFLAGIMEPAALGDFLRRFQSDEAWLALGPDLGLMGAVGGIPLPAGAPAQARTAMLSLLRELLAGDVDPPQAAGVLGALDRALAGLHAEGQGQGSAGDALLSELDTLLRDHREARLTLDLRRRGWPLPPRVKLLAPGAEDRRLDPARLPGR